MPEGQAPGAAPRAVGLVSLPLLLIAGVGGSVFWLARDRGPAPEAFQAAADLIRGEHRPGDLLFLAPIYATRARERLGDLHPLAVADPLEEDLEAHPRVWIFGLFGEAERLRPSLLRAGLELEASRTPAPGIVVDRYLTHGHQQVTYSFLTNLRRARVYHERNGQRTPCSTWNELNGQGGRAGRWQCPYDTDWFYVAPEWHRMGEAMRLCLWAHPPNQGRLVIAFPDVPLTGLIRGRAGHPMTGALNARAPVALDVQVGELMPQRFSFGVREPYRTFLLDVPETGTATVSFSISTADAGTNHFCFVADMRTP